MTALCRTGNRTTKLSKIDTMNNDEQKLNDILSPDLHKANVSGSHSFKEQLINDIIPRIEVMAKKEKEHLHWLIDHDAPTDFIQLSQKYYNHFTQRIKEYREYADCL